MRGVLVSRPKICYAVVKGDGRSELHAPHTVGGATDVGGCALRLSVVFLIEWQRQVNIQRAVVFRCPRIR